MNFTIVFVDFIGILGFIAACIFAWRNYHLTRFATPMWFIFGMAMGLGALWSSAALLENSGFYPEVMNAAGYCLFCVMVGILVVFSIISQGSEFKPI